MSFRYNGDILFEHIEISINDRFKCSDCFLITWSVICEDGTFYIEVSKTSDRFDFEYLDKREMGVHKNHLYGAIVRAVNNVYCKSESKKMTGLTVEYLEG